MPQDVLDAGGPSLSYRLAVHLHGTFFRPVVLEGLAGALDVRACGNNNSRSKSNTDGELVKGGREVAAEHDLEVNADEPLLLLPCARVHASRLDRFLFRALASFVIASFF